MTVCPHILLDALYAIRMPTVHSLSYPRGPEGQQGIGAGLPLLASCNPGTQKNVSVPMSPPNKDSLPYAEAGARRAGAQPGPSITCSLSVPRVGIPTILASFPGSPAPSASSSRRGAQGTVRQTDTSQGIVGWEFRKPRRCSGLALPVAHLRGSRTPILLCLKSLNIQFALPKVRLRLLM